MVQHGAVRVKVTVAQGHYRKYKVSASVYLGLKTSLRFHLSMHLSIFYFFLKVKTIIKCLILNKQCRKHAGNSVCKSSLCQFSDACRPHR